MSDDDLDAALRGTLKEKIAAGPGVDVLGWILTVASGAQAIGMTEAIDERKPPPERDP